MWWLLLLVGVLLALSSSPTIAQSPLAKVSYCGAGFVGPFRQQSEPVNAIADVMAADWHVLLSVDAIASDLEMGFQAATLYCATHHPTNPVGEISVSISVSNRQIISAHKHAGDANWSITLNLLPTLQADEQKKSERKQREADEKRRIAEAQEAYERRIKDSRALFDEFNAKAQISDWPQMRNLIADPLRFRGKIIAFQATATPDNGSLFSVEGGLVFAPAVPMKITANGEFPFLLATKVVGVTQINWKGQTISVPSLEYKDSYACKLRNCEDVLFWINPTKS